MTTERKVYVEGSAGGHRPVCKVVSVNETPATPQRALNDLLFGDTAFRVPERPTLKSVSG